MPSKGATALLAAILAASQAYGVRGELQQHWDMDDARFSEQVNRRVTRVTAKAWRFEGEMREIAPTFRDAGLPYAFHLAAAEIHHCMVGFKDTSNQPKLNEILDLLLRQ